MEPLDNPIDELTARVAAAEWLALWWLNIIADLKPEIIQEIERAMDGTPPVMTNPNRPLETRARDLAINERARAIVTERLQAMLEGRRKDRREDRQH